MYDDTGLIRELLKILSLNPHKIKYSYPPKQIVILTMIKNLFETIYVYQKRKNSVYHGFFSYNSGVIRVAFPVLEAARERCEICGP